MGAPVATLPRPAPVAAVALALAAVYLVWGSTYLGIRLALEGGWPPLLMAGGRFVLAGGLLFAVLRLRGVRPPTRAQWPSVAVMGVAMMALGNGLVTIAEQWVSSGLAAVAVASMPLWMGVFGAMRGRWPTGLEAIGLGVGFVGVVWLNAHGTLQSEPRGLVALLVATIAWAWASVWSRGRDLPPPFMSAAAQMLVGGAAMLLVALLRGESFAGTPTWSSTLWVGYLVVFGSIIGFTAYVWLLDNVRPALAGSYAYVNPVIAVLLGGWIAAERFSMHDLGAMVVVLSGVVAITFGRARLKAVS